MVLTRVVVEKPGKLFKEYANESNGDIDMKISK